MNLRYGRIIDRHEFCPVQISLGIRNLKTGKKSIVIQNTIKESEMKINGKF